MVKIKMYSKIQELKMLGFSKNKVAKQLNLHRMTVKKYWEMNVDEYETIQNAKRKPSQMDQYQGIILQWLQKYPDMSAAQVEDWLKEHYFACFKSRTVSRYVEKLRKKHNLPKTTSPRVYEAVKELPMGQQVQVDFGQRWLENASGKGKTQVYAAVFVLSHSRFKYVWLQSRPFSAEDLVRACHRCFDYFGGKPQEMVFDQDSIVCVSENNGDIIYTNAFEKFKQAEKMKIYMCRGADPETKGKVENAVKYVAGNFLKHRKFENDQILNEQCLGWLERTGNALEHGTTKKVPAEVFSEEKLHLKPLISSEIVQKTEEKRVVRKDSTILYKSNRFSVPLGTFLKEKEVIIEVIEGNLHISTTFGEELCQHKIPYGRGILVQCTSHTRDRTTKIDTYQKNLIEKLGEESAHFLEEIRKEYPRYPRDQFGIISSLLQDYTVEEVKNSIVFCEKTGLFSCNYVRDFLLHSKPTAEETPPKSDETRIVVDHPKYHEIAQKRPLSEYAFPPEASEKGGEPHG